MFEPHLEALEDGRIRPLTPGAAAFLPRLKGRPFFACVVASTETASIPGISAAGETPEKRRYTAALDAEFLVFGKPLTLPEIPKNPLGPPSPVVVTRAALEAMGVAPLVVDAGTAVPPLAPRLDLGGAPARCLSTGQALDLGESFLENARAAGRLVASAAPWLILAESVPGGTTTALAVLEGLGVRARGRVSSSMPGGNHQLKWEVASRGLSAAGLTDGSGALRVAAAVGDSMQPAVALMALEASLRVPVVLGGGTQMAAVAALALRLLAEGHPGDAGNLALATTRWVSEDASADLAPLLGDISPASPFPAFAAGLDFSGSRLPNLRRYEEGLVKEGVGAGAAAFAAFLVGGESHAELLERIERTAEGSSEG